MKLIHLIIFFLILSDIHSQETMLNFKRYTAKEVKKIIKEKSGRLSPDLKKKYFIDGYILDDKSLLIDYNTHGIHYNSINDFIELIESRIKIQNETPFTHYLKGVFSTIEEFNSTIQSNIDYVNTTFEIYGLPNLENLKKIDSIYNTGILEKKRTTLLPSLIVYVGEIIRNNVKMSSQWAFKQDVDDMDVVEPYIKTDLTEYEPSLLVYKELFEEFSETGSITLYDHTIIELANRIK